MYTESCLFFIDLLLDTLIFIHTSFYVCSLLFLLAGEGEGVVLAVTPIVDE
jgi:hypothetical protein